jgi:hypothetical protein
MKTRNIMSRGISMQHGEQFDRVLYDDGEVKGRFEESSSTTVNCGYDYNFNICCVGRPASYIQYQNKNKKDQKEKAPSQHKT